MNKKFDDEASYLKSLADLGLPIDVPGFDLSGEPSQSHRPQLSSSLWGGRGSRGSRGRGRGRPPRARGRGMMNSATTSTPTPPKKSSPKYTYEEPSDDEWERDTEIMPSSGKKSRAERLQQRKERVSTGGSKSKASLSFYASEKADASTTKRLRKGEDGPWCSLDSTPEDQESAKKKSRNISSERINEKSNVYSPGPSRGRGQYSGRGSGSGRGWSRLGEPVSVKGLGRASTSTTTPVYLDRDISNGEINPLVGSSRTNQFDDDVCVTAVIPGRGTPRRRGRPPLSSSPGMSRDKMASRQEVQNMLSQSHDPNMMSHPTRMFRSNRGRSPGRGRGDPPNVIVGNSARFTSGPPANRSINSPGTSSHTHSHSHNHSHNHSHSHDSFHSPVPRGGFPPGQGPRRVCHHCPKHGRVWKTIGPVFRGYGRKGFTGNTRPETVDVIDLDDDDEDKPSTSGKRKHDEEESSSEPKDKKLRDEISIEDDPSELEAGVEIDGWKVQVASDSDDSEEEVEDGNDEASENKDKIDDGDKVLASEDKMETCEDENGESKVSENTNNKNEDQDVTSEDKDDKKVTAEDNDTMEDKNEVDQATEDNDVIEDKDLATEDIGRIEDKNDNDLTKEDEKDANVVSEDKNDKDETIEDKSDKDETSEDKDDSNEVKNDSNKDKSDSVESDNKVGIDSSVDNEVRKNNTDIVNHNDEHNVKEDENDKHENEKDAQQQIQNGAELVNGTEFKSDTEDREAVQKMNGEEETMEVDDSGTKDSVNDEKMTNDISEKVTRPKSTDIVDENNEVITKTDSCNEVISNDFNEESREKPNCTLNKDGEKDDGCINVSVDTGNGENLSNCVKKDVSDCVLSAGGDQDHGSDSDQDKKQLTDIAQKEEKMDCEATLQTQTCDTLVGSNKCAESLDMADIDNKSESRICESVETENEGLNQSPSGDKTSPGNDLLECEDLDPFSEIEKTCAYIEKNSV